MYATNRRYATYFSAAPQIDRVGERGHAQTERWLEQDHGGLEVDHDRGAGIQARYPSGIEVDQSQVPQWVERDPSAPPTVLASNRLELMYTGAKPAGTDTSHPTQRRAFFGLPRKWVWILLSLLALAIVGAGIGSGVGAALRHRSRVGRGGVSPSNSTRSSLILQNSSIAAVQFGDDLGNKFYRVYVQSNEGLILEAAWASNSPSWKTSRVTDGGVDIRLGTPMTAAAGDDYDNTTLAAVRSPGGPANPKRVYFVGQKGTIYERASPYKRREDLWRDGLLDGIYTVSNDSSIFSFWYRNESPRTQILAVLFQESKHNALSIAQYRSKDTGGTPWTSTEQSFQIQDGSAIAVAPTGDRRDLRLYVADTGGKMAVYQYNLTNNSVSDAIQTIFDLPLHAPLSVSIQDNRNYFTTTTLPDCAKEGNQPLTHLIIFPKLDKSSLTLVSWNCSGGFLDQTTMIEPLIQANRTYLGLTNTITSIEPEDQRVYVLFDAGDGPEIEEWQVPPGAQNADWRVLGTVPVAFI